MGCCVGSAEGLGEIVAEGAGGGVGMEMLAGTLGAPATGTVSYGTKTAMPRWTESFFESHSA